MPTEKQTRWSANSNYKGNNLIVFISAMVILTVCWRWSQWLYSILLHRLQTRIMRFNDVIKSKAWILIFRFQSPELWRHEIRNIDCDWLIGMIVIGWLENGKQLSFYIYYEKSCSLFCHSSSGTCSYSVCFVNQPIKIHAFFSPWLKNNFLGEIFM